MKLTVIRLSDTPDTIVASPEATSYLLKIPNWQDADPSFSGLKLVSDIYCSPYIAYLYDRREAENYWKGLELRIGDAVPDADKLLGALYKSGYLIPEE